MAINTPHVSTSAPRWALLASTFPHRADSQEDGDDLASADSAVDIYTNLPIGLQTPWSRSNLSGSPTHLLLEVGFNFSSQVRPCLGKTNLWHRANFLHLKFPRSINKLSLQSYLHSLSIFFKLISSLIFKRFLLDPGVSGVRSMGLLVSN